MKESRTTMNQKSNKELKNKFRELGIEYCEVCGSNQWLTFCHRQKRRHYGSAKELADIQEVLLACIQCHQRLEFDSDELEATFKRLRP